MRSYPLITWLTLALLATLVGCSPDEKLNSEQMMQMIASGEVSEVTISQDEIRALSQSGTYIFEFSATERDDALIAVEAAIKVGHVKRENLMVKEVIE